MRINLAVPFEVGYTLNYLAHHWNCTQREALSRILLEAWKRAGCPIPGYNVEGNPLPGNAHFKRGSVLYGPGYRGTAS